MVAVQQRPLEQKCQTYVNSQTYQDWLRFAVAMSVEVWRIVDAKNVEAFVLVIDVLIVQF